MSKNNQTVFIWVDFSEEIGLGHVSRCASLADVLSNYYEIKIVSRNSETSNFFKGYEFIKIPNEINLASNSFVEILKDNNAYLAITDVKYKLNEDFFYNIKNNSKKYICIENISPGVFYADMLLFPALHFNPDIFKKTFHKDIDHSKIFHGEDWVIIRKEVEDYRISESKNNGDIVITTGGTDPNGIFFILWEIFKKIDVKAYFLIGENFKYRDKLPKGYKKLVVESFNLKRITDSSVVISSFGVSIVECLYLNKKVLGITHHQEDDILSENLSSKISSYFHIGNYREINFKDIKNQLLLAKNYDASQIQNLIDGKGKKRILDWVRA